MEIQKLVEEMNARFAQKNGGTIAATIDHTLLKPQSSREEIRAVCEEAVRYGASSVCVNPCYIEYVARLLEGTGVTPCCVIGFPLGANTPAVKAFEAADAVSRGAREVDMVLNVGAVKSGEWELVHRDIAGVVAAVRGRAAVKVILETCLLTDEEKVRACAVAKHAGADFVKTSTGFSTGGATVEDVRLMRAAVGPTLGVKASGGIRSYEDAKAMLDAGATRIGASATAKIVAGERK